MEEWKEYKLEEICTKITDGSHFSPQACQTGYPMFSVKDMHEYGFDYSNCKHISAKDFESMKNGDCVPQKGDILVAKDGSFLKQIFECKETKEEAILSSIAMFRPNQDFITPTFLCYLLKSPKVYNYIASNCVSGSALPRIVLKDFKKVSMQVPPLPTQQKIAAILSSLDDKIELNNKINTNLERQAGALFKNWFVDFEPFGGKMPDGWKIGKLSDIAEITMGQSPNGKSYNEDGIGTVFYQGRAEFGTRFPTRRLFTTEPKRIAKKFDTLMSVRAPVGDLNIANEDCCIGRGLAAIHSKDNHQSFVHYTVVTLRPQLDVFNGEGTVFGCINRDALNNMEVIIPSKIDLDKFEKIVTTMDIDIFNRSEENDRLKNIRDTLLPKLMNGEIEV